MDHRELLDALLKELLIARVHASCAWRLVADHSDWRSASPRRWDVEFRTLFIQLDDLVQDTRDMLAQP